MLAIIESLLPSRPFVGRDQPDHRSELPVVICFSLAGLLVSVFLEIKGWGLALPS